MERNFKPSKGVSYYRLKQTDFDGKSEYFNVVAVNFENDNVKGYIAVYPNPISIGETLKVKLKDIVEKEVLVVLRNLEGKDFYSKLVLNIEGEKLIGIPIDRSIPPGVYLISASSENHVYSKKINIK